jgi:hypothetical protein
MMEYADEKLSDIRFLSSENNETDFRFAYSFERIVVMSQ